MNSHTRVFGFAPALLLVAGIAYAGKYSDTTDLFRNAGEIRRSSIKAMHTRYFRPWAKRVWAWAGHWARGHVYVHGQFCGDMTMGQVSVGFQAGGKAYSQIIFFEDKRALDKLSRGRSSLPQVRAR
jgi:hypothetical protein